MDERPTDLNREEKKRELRSRIIDTPDEDYERRLRRHRMRLLLCGAAVLLVLAVAAGVYFYRQNIKKFTGCEVTSAVELAFSGDYEFLPFGENVVYYGKNSAAYLNAAGETVWTKAYEMSNPIAVVSGGYMAIADQKGSTIAIFDESGCLGTAATSLPVSRIALAEQGMVAAILEDDVANYIVFYNKSGTKLNIEIKTVISGDGYPLALSLSPSGESLMVSYVGVAGEGLQNKIMFYNFTVGQDKVDKLIAGFEHYDNTLIARTHFFSNDAAVAVGDDTLTFFSFETESSVKIAEEIALTEEICYTLFSEKYVGLVFRNTQGAEAYRLLVYGKDGSQVLDMPFAFGYEELRFCGDEVLMYNRSAVAVYYLDGTLKFEDELESNYDIILPANAKNEYITVGNELMQILKPTVR